MSKLLIFLFDKFHQFLPKAYFSQQFRKPTGLVGKFVVNTVFKKGNVNLTNFMASQYKPDDSHSLLDIGFGPGQFFINFASQVKHMSGLDFSQDVVTNAEKKFKKLISDNKLELKKGEISQIPYQNNHFDTIFTANTLYFWPDPVNDSREVLRVLKPEGQFILGFRTREQLKDDIDDLDKNVFNFYSNDEVENILNKAGFRKIKTKISYIGGKEFSCIISKK